MVLGAGLGLIPGCMGGFAAVSMYSHKLLSFGALIAMMIASSGDEAFVMFAMIPKQALLLMAVLFVVAVLAGWLVDKLSFRLPFIDARRHDIKGKHKHEGCEEGYQIHEEDHHEGTHHPEKATLRNMKHASAERIALLLGILLFIVALAFGMLEHDHEEATATEPHLCRHQPVRGGIHRHRARACRQGASLGAHHPKAFPERLPLDLRCTFGHPSRAALFRP